MLESLILVPIDLSPLGEAKLPVVEKYARLLDAEVLLLHALPSAVLGSVADQVVRSAPCPVLLVRPGGRPTRAHALRSFAEDAERAGARTQRNLGVRTIETSRIVGSVGRHQELGPDFRPSTRRRRGPDEDRYRRITRAIEGGAEMPPIDVYKLGFGYYVLDGHHRLAAALHNGQLEIDASVTEFLPAADEQAPER